MSADEPTAPAELPPISEVAAAARAEVDARVEAIMAETADVDEAGPSPTEGAPKAGDGWRRGVFLDELRNLPVFPLGVGMLGFVIVALWAFNSTSPRGVIIENQCQVPVEARYIPESFGDTQQGHESTVIPVGETLELEPLLVLDFPHFKQANGYDEDARKRTIRVVLSEQGNTCPTPLQAEPTE